MAGSINLEDIKKDVKSNSYDGEHGTIKLKHDWAVPYHEQNIHNIQFAPKNLDDEGWQKDYTAKLISLVKMRGVALDIGANVGYMSRPLSKHFREVHSFEPIPLVCECLKRNVENRGNVTVYNNAVGHLTDTVLIEYNPNKSGASSIKDAPNSCTIEVPMVRLDDFDFDQVHLIKVDTEGHEHRVLQGAKELIERDRPLIALEKNSESWKTCRDFLVGLDYVLVAKHYKHELIYAPIEMKLKGIKND